MAPSIGLMSHKTRDMMAENNKIGTKQNKNSRIFVMKLMIGSMVYSLGE